jgi:hypothetical protein
VALLLTPNTHVSFFCPFYFLFLSCTPHPRPQAGAPALPPLPRPPPLPCRKEVAYHSGDLRRAELIEKQKFFKAAQIKLRCP